MNSASPSPGSTTLLRGTLLASAEGASAGLAYGTASLLVLGPLGHALGLGRAGGLPLLGNLVVLAIFAGCGKLAAILAGARASQSREQARQLQLRAGAAATALIALASGAQLIAQWKERHAHAGTALILGVVLLAAAARLLGRTLPDALAGLSRAWLAAPLVVAINVLLERLLVESGRGLKVLAIALLLAAALSAAALWERLARGAFAKVPQPALLGCAASTLIAAAALAAYQAGVTGVLHQPAPLTAAVGKAAPNVVLISLDTVRADHLSLYGYARTTTPELQKLAQTSVVFERAFASSNMTLSTHASMLTGRWVRDHGARYFPEPRPLRAGTPTLAQALRAAGYRTAAVVSNFGFLGREWGMAPGFDYYDDRTAAPLLGESESCLLQNALRDVLAPIVPRRERELLYRDAHEINAAALAGLDAVAAPGHPFFLFLNYMDAHSPYLPPAPYDTLFPGKLPGFDSAHEDAVEREVLQGKRHILPAEHDHFVSQYDAGIAFADAELARLFAVLRARGLWQNTLVIVTGDHGEAFGERDIVGHGSSLYDDQIRVPLLIHAPGATQASRTNALASSIDLAPTIRAAAGLPVDPALPGRDLLSPEPAQARVVYAESYSNPYLLAWNARFKPELFAAIAWPYKLIVGSNGSVQALDLAADPAELAPFDGNASQVAAIRATLQAWRAHAEPSGAAANAPLPGADTSARLKALGYVK